MFFNLLARLFRTAEKPSHHVQSSKIQYSSVDSLGFDDVKGEFNSFRRDALPQATSLSIASPTDPYAIYNGGYDDAKDRGICLRIANGGAGQTGLIRAWADAFIQYMVHRGVEPFEVAWYLGDTTESLALLASGAVDVALTYNAAAETQLLNSGDAIERIYAFRDHFLLVGPISNPAQLDDSDDILTMFSKIVACGNADVAKPPDPDIHPATRFLSRFDKSATNIKESQIFTTIGQVPWALDYSKWYHQYPQFPREALQAAALLSEYTLTDQGSWLCAPKALTRSLKAFKVGSNDPSDPLLNPAHLLCSNKVPPAHENICRAFMTWVKAPDGGQRVTETFSQNGHILYSKAP
ncbi:hypothetical protein BDZ97DRAFT_1665317 [Flammula alnicola]|nr:hypothetical protein BDZ97DRAFT_1665317 [Flammula alnicola]